MSAPDPDFVTGERPPLAESGYDMGSRFASELFPQHRGRSGVPGVLNAAEKVAAHKAAVDEIRSYCGGVMMNGSRSQQLIVGDVLKILDHHGLTLP